MNKKIKVNIPGFGERYCSNDVEYILFSNKFGYEFCKNGIRHNEYGPAFEMQNKTYGYFIKYKYHRLSNPAFYNDKYESYYVIGCYLGATKEEFIKKIANILIPNEYENEQEN